MLQNMRVISLTVLYFTRWGSIYGLIIGFLTGALAWTNVSVVGAVAGVIAGPLVGFGIGLFVALIHALTFHNGMDLARYQRFIAVFNGCLSFIGGFYGFYYLITGNLASIAPSIQISESWPLIAVFVLESVILTTLSITYISRHYLDWIQKEIDPSHPSSPEPRPLFKAVTRLWKQFFRPIPLIIGASLELYFCIHANILTNRTLATTHSAINGIAGLIVIYVGLTFYLSLGNAIVTTLLRRLIFDTRVITYRYQFMIAVFSFLFTGLMTSWSWTLPPFRTSPYGSLFEIADVSGLVGKIMPFVLGMLVAYHVYHTLAESDDDTVTPREAVSQIAGHV